MSEDEKKEIEQNQSEIDAAEEARIEALLSSKSKEKNNWVTVDDFSNQDSTTSSKPTQLSWVSASDVSGSKNKANDVFSSLENEMNELKAEQMVQNLKDEITDLLGNQLKQTEEEIALLKSLEKMVPPTEEAKKQSEFDESMNDLDRSLDELNEQVEDDQQYNLAVNQVSEGLENLAAMITKQTDRIRQIIEVKKAQKLKKEQEMLEKEKKDEEQTQKD